jgi:hypothetical protein
MLVEIALRPHADATAVDGTTAATTAFVTLAFSAVMVAIAECATLWPMPLQQSSALFTPAH